MDHYILGPKNSTIVRCFLGAPTWLQEYCSTKISVWLQVNQMLTYGPLLQSKNSIKIRCWLGVLLIKNEQHHVVHILTSHLMGA